MYIYIYMYRERERCYAYIYIYISKFIRDGGVAEVIGEKGLCMV